MKAKVETQDLKRALSNVGNAIGGMRTIPIMGSVRIEAKDKKMILAATDLSIMITDKLPARVEEEGVLILSQRLLSNFINRATSGEVSFGVMDDKPAIRHGDNVGKFESLNDNEWPGRLNPGQGNILKCGAVEFATPIRKVMHAMYTETERYILRGVAIQKRDKQTDFVATDGRRMSVYMSDIEWPDIPIIIPDVAVAVIAKLIQQDETELSIGKDCIIIKNGDLEIDSRLIEGEYPRYAQLLPESVKTAFSAPRKDLIDAARTAVLFLDRDQVAVTLEGKKNKLRVSYTDRFKTELLGAELNGQAPDPVSLSGHFLIDALDVLEEDDVRIEYAGGTSPAAIREGKLLEVIMPCLTREGKPDGQSK